MTVPYSFNRGKPFYPIVMSYILQLHGLTELAILGLPGITRKHEIHPHAESDDLRKGLEKLQGPLNLRVTGDSEPMDIHILKSTAEFVQNFSYLASFQVTAASHCIVMGYEVTKDKPYRTIDPIWEFLRHCRNAIAHNGQFSFNQVEPRNLSEWRGIQIVKEMEGEPLLKNQNGKGFLNLGDPIALLWDIEQAFPSISV